MPMHPPDPCALAVWAATTTFVLKSGLRITPTDLLTAGDGSMWFQHKLTDEERAEVAAYGLTRFISPGITPASDAASERPVRMLPFGRRLSDARPPLQLEEPERRKA